MPKIKNQSDAPVFMRIAGIRLLSADHESRGVFILEVTR